MPDRSGRGCFGPQERSAATSERGCRRRRRRPSPPSELRRKYPITRTMTPPIPNRLAISGSRQPSAFRRPPPPKPMPPRPVSSSKLLLSGSSPKRMPLSSVAGPMRERSLRLQTQPRAPPSAPLSKEALDDSRRQSRAGHRFDVRHRPGDRQGARRRRREADDQRIWRSRRDRTRMRASSARSTTAPTCRTRLRSNG